MDDLLDFIANIKQQRTKIKNALDAQDADEDIDGNQQYARNAKNFITIWSEIGPDKQSKFRNQIIVRFPEIFSRDYENAGLWLLFEKQIYCPNVRDIFSSGGQIPAADGIKLPRIFFYLQDKKNIANIFKNEGIVCDFGDWIKQVKNCIKKTKYFFQKEKSSKKGLVKSDVEKTKILNKFVNKCLRDIRKEVTPYLKKNEVYG